MAEVKKVLVLDTALFGCTVGVLDTVTGKCAALQKPMPRGQAEVLVPMVQEALAEAGCGFEDIDLIGVTIGPGAFTGLRIGLAAAQGFGIALKKPVAGLSTLDVLAAQFFKKDRLAEGQLLGVLIETKRQDYYCRFFKADGTPHSEPQALSGEDLADLAAGQDVVYIGDAVSRFGQGREGYELPDPCIMATLAAEQYRREGVRELTPLYLRGADVSKPKKETRKILEK